jgi:hypothetical protein
LAEARIRDIFIPLFYPAAVSAAGIPGLQEEPDRTEIAVKDKVVSASKLN